MPVGRVLLNSISESRKLARLKTDGARLLYSWTLAHLNIIGCFSADPQVVNGKIFTRLNKSKTTVKKYLDELEKLRLIYRYQVEGDFFLIYPDFVDRQPFLNPSREGDLTIPIPPLNIIKKCSGATRELIMSYSGTKYKFKSKYKIKFNEDTEEWEGITKKDIERWQEAYPSCDIMVELYKMREWLIANPKRRKKNYRRFITNWLSTSQDRGGTIDKLSYRRQDGVKRWLEKKIKEIENLKENTTNNEEERS